MLNSGPVGRPSRIGASEVQLPVDSPMSEGLDGISEGGLDPKLTIFAPSSSKAPGYALRMLTDSELRVLTIYLSSPGFFGLSSANSLILARPDHSFWIFTFPCAGRSGPVEV